MSEGQEGYGTVFVSAGGGAIYPIGKGTMDDVGHRDDEVKVNDHWSVCFGEAGHLSWDKDGRELHFEGNADAAAMYFFDRLIQYSNEYIARLETENATLRRVLTECKDICDEQQCDDESGAMLAEHLGTMIDKALEGRG